MHNIDVTGLTALKDLTADMLKYGGKNTQLRLVGLNERVTHRFERFGWSVADADDIGKSNEERKKVTPVYKSVKEALRHPGRTASEDEITPVEVHVGGIEKDEV